MFEQTLLPVPERGPQSASFAASMAAQFLLVAALLLIPLFFVEALPMVRLDPRLFAPPMPKPIAVTLVAVPRALAEAFRPTTAPKIFLPPRTPNPLPKTDTPELPEAAPMAKFPGPGGVTELPGPTGPGAGTGSQKQAEKPRPPEQKPKPETEAVTPAPTAPVRVSAGVQMAKLIKRVVPSYPALAKQARIQGTVRLVGIIDVDGRIKNLQVLSGHPLLVPAAVEAVRQWVYEPTTLNNRAVEVIAPIDVNFTLSQ